MAFQGNAFQGFQSVGAVAPSASPAAGGPGKGRRKFKKRHVVTIDGEDYVVESLADAAALVAELREEVAEAVAEAAIEKKPIKLPRIRASGPKGPELNELVAMVSHERDMLKAAFASVARDAEIARLMYEMAEQDDEDALMALIH
jgi:hypothetical protein